MIDSRGNRGRRNAGWQASAAPKTPWLRAGGDVRVVATGFAVRRAALARGVGSLRRSRYRVTVGAHCADRDGYLAGTDTDRSADLVDALTDPSVRAVWFARGGYGTARLLDDLPWRKIARAEPRVLIGYSDLTALFAAYARREIAAQCVYGPVVVELPDRGAWHRPSLRAVLEGAASTMRFRARDVVAPGTARGRLFGGNLTVLAHLAGTRHFPDLRGGILALEDVGEPVYRIDRALVQLRQAGAFRDLAGVLLGGFSPPARKRFPPDRAIDDVLAEPFADLGVPVVRGLPFGHVSAKRSLPLGGQAVIDTDARRVSAAPVPAP